LELMIVAASACELTLPGLKLLDHSLPLFMLPAQEGRDFFQEFLVSRHQSGGRAYFGGLRFRELMFRSARIDQAAVFSKIPIRSEKKYPQE